MKPCAFCGKPAPATFNAARAFDRWVDANQIICPWRSRFDGMRERLKWASLDETDEGAHVTCAIKWAAKEEGYSKRYDKM